MIQDDPLQIDRSLFCGHKICVDLAHILYTAQSVQYVYNIYIYIYTLIFGSSVSTVLSLGDISLGT